MAFPVPEIMANADWSFGWGANSNIGGREAVGGRDGAIGKSIGEFL